MQAELIVQWSHGTKRYRLGVFTAHKFIVLTTLGFPVSSVSKCTSTKTWYYYKYLQNMQPRSK